MKFHRYKDGRDRATIRVDFNMTVYDMATVITAWFSTEFLSGSGDTVDETSIKKRLPNMRKTLEHLRDALHSDGFEVPFYRVGDQNLEKVRDAVQERIEWLLAKQQEHLKETVPAE